MLNLRNFFKDKRVLITGHTGFIGSWLSEWLVMLQAEVCGYSLDPSTVPNAFSALDISSKVEDNRGDVRDIKSLDSVITKFKPEIVFHLAAQPIVLESYSNPVETFETNVIGTVNVLNVLRKVDSLKVITVMTSDKVYRNNEWPYPYRENDFIGGRDPYSASKSCQDIAVNSFRESFFEQSQVGVSTVRAGNVIGGGDWGKHRIIPDIVQSISSDQKMVIRNPNSVRPWQHVLEPIYGMFVLVSKMWENLKFSGDWNLGPLPEREISVSELYRTFVRFWGKDIGYRLDGEPKFGESERLKLDISKARMELGWYPVLNIEESIEKTVEWYKQFLANRKDITDVTDQQILEYMELRNRYAEEPAR